MFSTFYTFLCLTDFTNLHFFALFDLSDFIDLKTVILGRGRGGSNALDCLAIELSRPNGTA